MSRRTESAPFLKSLTKMAGDMSILTRAKVVRKDPSPTRTVPQPRASLSAGGPKSRAVVCGYCFQPASSGPCRSYPHTGILFCGEWIRDSRLDSQPVLQRGCKPRQCRHGRKSTLEHRSSKFECEQATTQDGCNSPNSAVSPVSPISLQESHHSNHCYDNVFLPDPSESTYWLGCEFIYSLKSETLKVTIKQTGELQHEYACNEDLRANFFLEDLEGREVKKSTKLGTVGKLIKSPIKIRFKEYSCWRVQHMAMRVELQINNGLFRNPETIEQWSFPLTSCHFLYTRTHWHHVQ